MFSVPIPFKILITVLTLLIVTLISVNIFSLKNKSKINCDIDVLEIGDEIHTKESRRSSDAVDDLFREKNRYKDKQALNDNQDRDDTSLEDSYNLSTDSFEYKIFCNSDGSEKALLIDDTDIHQMEDKYENNANIIYYDKEYWNE